MLKVRNLTSSRSGREVANQFVIRDTENKKVTFQSYDSPIIEIDFANNILKVFRNWNYSKTTGKYRNQFMNEEFFGLDNSKDLEKAMNDGQWEGWKVIKVA